jgi:hypothetical protein
VAEQESPGLGDLDGPPAPRPLDKPLADQRLELVDVIAYRRQRAVQLLRGRPERAGLGDRAQGAKMLELDARPIIRDAGILRGKCLLLRTFNVGTLEPWRLS